MILEPIEQKHLLACVDLFTAIFNNEPWRENWQPATALVRLQAIYNTPGFYGIAALDEVQIIGFALGYVEQWDQQQVFYLKEMCVKTQLQRQGIGGTILEMLERCLIQQGINKVYLLTARDGMAEAFYKKCGFYVSPKMVMMGKRLS